MRFVLIGIGGANYFAETAGLVFSTQDRDLFLPADPANELKAWHVCRGEGFKLIDLTLVMAGFEFEEVWSRRRTFKVQGVSLPVAALSDIVASKAAAGRPKDQLFLATHQDALRQLLGKRFGGNA